MQHFEQHPELNSGQHQKWMQDALLLANRAQQLGEVPVGAVLVQGDELIAEGWNQPIASHDATAHAEIQAIRKAGALLQNYRLPDTTLYITLEPCAMCAGAIVHARIKTVVYAADDPKTGAAKSVFSLLDTEQLNHRCEVISGVCADQSSLLLKQFFASRR